MRFSVDITQGRSALDSDFSSCIVYKNGPHSGEIDHQTVVAERAPTYVVPAAANRRQ